MALLVCLGILTVPLTPLQRQRLLLHWRRRRGGGSGPDRGPELGAATPDLEYLGA